MPVCSLGISLPKACMFTVQSFVLVFYVVLSSHQSVKYSSLSEMSKTTAGALKAASPTAVSAPAPATAPVVRGPRTRSSSRNRSQGEARDQLTPSSQEQQGTNSQQGNASQDSLGVDGPVAKRLRKSEDGRYKCSGGL